MSATVIAVANCKGGCGKTTTAVNLAAELAARGYRTLLVDLDPQGQASLGRAPSPGAATAHDLLCGARILHDQVTRGQHGGPDLLPADPGYRSAATPPRPRALAESLAGLAKPYDAIIFDTAPAVDPPLVAALAAADFVLTPTQLTPLACEGVMRFAQVFFYVVTQINPGLRAFAIASTQVDLRTRVQQAAWARLGADFGPERLFPAIRSDVNLAEAFGCGLPVRDFRPESRGAADYAALADEVETAWFGRARPSRPFETSIPHSISNTPPFPALVALASSRKAESYPRSV